MSKHQASVPSPASSWATPVLINREDLLEKIYRAIADQSGRSYVFFITGDGGIGKTWVLQEVLNRCRGAHNAAWTRPLPADLNLYAATEPVDLYHPYLHSEEGLARAIRAVIDPGPGYFEEYQLQRDKLQRGKRDASLLSRELNRQRRVVDRTPFWKITNTRPVITGWCWPWIRPR
jgi:hypothetical protein